MREGCLPSWTGYCDGCPRNVAGQSYLCWGTIGRSSHCHVLTTFEPRTYSIRGAKLFGLGGMEAREPIFQGPPPPAAPGTTMHPIFELPTTLFSWPDSETMRIPSDQT